MIDPASLESLPCERVLILDGDLDALESLGPALVSEGVWVVHGATSRAEAELLLARGFRPCAVVLDPAFDAEHGKAFAHRLKTDPAFHRVPVIALSGDGAALQQVGGVVERSLRKPARAVEVLTALREVCRREAAAQAARAAT